MPLAPVPLGPYDLRVPIGRGGMGEVWRAVYRPSGAPVAVKVLRPAAASRPDLVACFHREVRAAAALDHPNVAPVLDAGDLSPEIEKLSGGRLKAGSPFLVTELAFGSLAGAPPPTTWAEVRAVLDALLGALAHAHARGVTHRDLKPGNVLLAAPLDADPSAGLPLGVGSLSGYDRSRVLLADFGLAWTAADGRSETETASGTPAYMAPEQLDGRWRDIGPWTDMYGLGCLVWWMVAGRTPFQPRTLEQAVLHHQHRMLPPLRPLIAAPEGLEAWLLRMVARDPSARFLCAADARTALAALRDADGSAGSGEEAGRVDPEVTLPLAAAGSRRSSPSESTSVVLPCVRRAPPIAPTWRVGGAPRQQSVVLGSGLALFGLRPPPLVGREHQRDVLWAELSLVHAERRTRAVVLHGRAGTGKSRLGTWLCELAHETGAAVPLVASFREGAAGLAGLIGATLGTGGLAGDELEARIETWLLRRGYQDPLAVRSIARVVEGGSEVASRTAFEAARLLVSLEARVRPVILLLDEAHASPEALGLAEHLLGTGGALPLLLVLTALTDAMQRATEGAARLRGLLAAPLVRSVAVGPLPSAYQRALTRGLLPLDPELAAEVEERSSGNPGFARELLAGWIARGALVPGPAGVSRAPGADLGPPEALCEAWTREIDERLAGAPPGTREALSIGAIFGEPVDVRLWTLAAAGVGLEVGEGLLAWLQEAGLVRALPGQRPAFAFTHPMLRASLELEAARAGRGPALHHAVAEAFLASGGAGAAAKVGRHVFAGGDAGGALALLDRTDELALREAAPEGLALLRLRERALGEARVPNSDRRWCGLWLLRSQVLVASCAPEEAARWAERAEEAARASGWRQLESSARLSRGRASLLRGHLDRAEALFSDALEGFTALDLWPAVAETHLSLAGVAVCRDDLPRATAELDAATALIDGMGSPRGRAVALPAGLSWLRGLAAIQEGDFTRARARLRAALDLYRGIGSRLGQARCLESLGSVARWEGLAARAESRTRQAITLAEVAGSAQAVIYAVPLALVALQREETSRARATAGGAIEQLSRLGLDADLALARLALGAAALLEGDTATWEAQRALAEPFLQENRHQTADLRWLHAWIGERDPTWRQAAETRPAPSAR